MKGSPLPARVPSTNNRVTLAAGRMLMRATGWKLAGNFPDIPQFVSLLAPHTSNWDFFVALKAKWLLGLRGMWIAKESIFRWPVRGFLERIGGIAIDRASSHGLVPQMVAKFEMRRPMVLVLSPEGTRKPVTHWHSGYWHIARGAGVPIVPIGLDYGRRTVNIGPPLTTSDSLENDERQLRAFFAQMKPRRPKNYIA